MSVDYPYSQGVSPDRPASYAYSPYLGPQFIDAWRQSRQAVLDQLPQPSSEGGAAVEAGNAPAGSIAALGRRVRKDFDDNRSDLERLLRNFEVTKRIYGEYTQSWRPRDNSDFTDMTHYVEFAELLDFAYENTGKFTFLNALLKCLDMLCSQWTTLPGSAHARLARLLTGERRHIDTLAERLAARP